MRILLCLIFLVVSQLTVRAQKVTYTIPGGYENEISREDYKKLVDLSIAAVAKRYAIDQVADGTIHIKEGAETEAFNLHNLIMKCAAVKNKADWSKVIQEHFDNLFLSMDEQKKIDPENYETIKKYLSLRIYPVEVLQLRGGPESLVTKSDLEGTYTLLMLDLPGAFRSVPKAMFARWKKDSAEVFKVAQENINQQSVEKVTQQFDLEQAKVEISFLGQEDYAASYALDLLHNSPELVGEWGSAVAIPNKGLVNICKISKDKPLDFVKFIQMTKPLIEKSFQEHPQPVSQEFFWYYKGKFTPFTVQSDANGNINVISPYGLTELMTAKK